MSGICLPGERYCTVELGLAPQPNGSLDGQARSQGKVLVRPADIAHELISTETAGASPQISCRSARR
jgi:hypothetical protein